MATSTGPGNAVEAMGEGRIFARQATGFVREVSPLSSLVFNFIPSLPPLVLAISVFWTLGAFPGANLYIAYWLAFLIAAALAVAYGLLSSAMPRSGGDYVLVSRTLHPALGVASSICLTTSSLLSAAFIALATAIVAVGPALTVVGLVSDSSTLVEWGAVVQTSRGWQFGIGLAAIGIPILIMASGWRTALRFQNWGVALTMVGLLVTAVVLLIKGHDGFVSNFNGFAQSVTQQPDTYGSLIAAAEDAGINTNPGSSLSNTWPAIGAIMGFGIYSWWSINIAGEIRRARRWSHVVTMVGGAFATMVTLSLFTALFFGVFGDRFFASVNALNGTEAYPFAAPPYYLFLASIAGGSTVLAWFLAATFVLAFLVLEYVIVFQPVRAVFAYSFDGLLPYRAAHVTARRHVPTVALAVTFGLFVAGLAWAVWSASFFSVLATAIVIQLVAMTLVAVSAGLLPYRKPDLWRASATASTVAGVPVITLAALLAVVGCGVAYFLFFYYSGLALGRPLVAVRNIALVIAAGLVFYYVAKFVRRRAGVDLAGTYAEIPPE